MGVQITVNFHRYFWHTKHSFLFFTPTARHDKMRANSGHEAQGSHMNGCGDNPGCGASAYSGHADPVDPGPMGP